MAMGPTFHDQLHNEISDSEAEPECEMLQERFVYDDVINFSVGQRCFLFCAIIMVLVLENFAKFDSRTIRLLL